MIFSKEVIKINIWLAATLRALFVLALGFFLIVIVEAQLSWIFVAFISVLAFITQLYLSKRKRNKEKNK